MRCLCGRGIKERSAADTERQSEIRSNRIWKLYLPAVALLLYPLRHVLTGIDLMDAGYALGNYRFFDSMGQMWKLATYLANVLGSALSCLPFGGTWSGMNAYTGLLAGGTAAAVYVFMAKRYGRQRGYRLMFFAAELVALSLCWAPAVILYQYLGYLIMTAAVLVLFCAVTEDCRGKYAVAGILLGLCVAVRMPNITYMAFIVPVWYFFFLKRRSYEGGLKRALQRTLLCIAGYLAGLLIPLGVIALRYGAGAYPEMIGNLFGMTDTATDYKPSSMLWAMLGDYIRYSLWLLLFLAYMAAGMLFFAIKSRMAGGRRTAAGARLFRGLYLAGFLVLLRLCYGRGMFDFDYTAYFSMYKWAVVYLLAVILLCIWMLLRKNGDDTLKLWSVFALVTIFITPLGSNNGLYPIINNLFLVAPVSVLLLAEACRALNRTAARPCNGDLVFAARAALGFIVLCTAIQSFLFGIGFIFHDAGSKRVPLRLQSGAAADGMRTTDEKAAQLQTLDRFLTESGLISSRVILYGDIPALAYIFDMEPAVFSTWPDLDSNALAWLEADLEAIDGDWPVVILGAEAVDRLTGQSGAAYEKLCAIRSFMQENGYAEVYTNDAYRVYRSAAD